METEEVIEDGRILSLGALCTAQLCTDLDVLAQHQLPDVRFLLFFFFSLEFGKKNYLSSVVL